MGSRGSLEGRWGTPGVLGGPWRVGGPGAFWGFQGAPRGPRGICGGRVRVEGPWGVLGAPKESGGGRRPGTETPDQGTRGPALTQRALGGRSGRP